MIDVFVSYAREDQPRVEPLVNWLEACGFSVWWDKRITPGHPFDDVIEKNLDTCRAVLVIWSQHSIESNWVQAEANEGLERSILVPVLLEDVKPPLAFRRIQGANLRGFPQQQDKEALSQLHDALRALINHPLPEPAPPPKPAQSWLRFTVPVLIGLVGIAWLFDFAPMEQTSAQFSFTAFADNSTDESSIYAALGDEIAFGLQRATGVAVIPADDRAIPSGYLVSGSTVPNGLLVTVEDVSAQSRIMQHTYSTNLGFSEVHDAVTRDLAALIGKKQDRVSYANPQAYRKYLLTSAMLREAPTIPRLRETQQQFLALIEEHPRFARAFSRLCGVELKMYRELSDPQLFDDAEKHCHRALTLDDSDWEVNLSLADLYRTSGQGEKALEIMQRTSAQQPYSGAVTRMLGVVYASLDRDEEALATYQRALKTEPNYWRNYNVIGEYYFLKGQYASAADYFALEVEHVRNKALSMNNLAGALYLQGDQQAAVVAWQESVSEEPSINALLNLGSVGFFDGDFQASVEYYTIAQNLAPADQRIAGHIADALRATDHPDAPDAYRKAITLAQAELAVNPEDHDVQGDMATYAAALGDEDAALTHLDKARSEEPGIDEVYDRALVFTRLQRQDEADRAKARLADMGYPQHLIKADANFTN